MRGTGFAKYLDWAADNIKSGNLTNLAPHEVAAITRSLSDSTTMRQFEGKLLKRGLQKVVQGAETVWQHSGTAVAKVATKQFAAKTISRLIVGANVFFVASAAINARAEGAGVGGMYAAGMRELIPADLIETGFKMTVVNGAEHLGNWIIPRADSNARLNRYLDQLDAVAPGTKQDYLRRASVGATFESVANEIARKYEGKPWYELPMKAATETWKMLDYNK